MDTIPFKDRPMFATIQDHLVRMFTNKSENKNLELTYIKLAPDEVNYQNQTENMYQIMVKGLHDAVHIFQIMNFILYFGHYLFNIRINMKAGTEGHFLIFDCSIQPPRRMNIILCARRRIKLPIVKLQHLTLDQIQTLFTPTHHPSSAHALATRRVADSNQFASMSMLTPYPVSSSPFMSSSSPSNIGMEGNGTVQNVNGSLSSSSSSSNGFSSSLPAPAPVGRFSFLTSALDSFKNHYLQHPPATPQQMGSLLASAPDHYIDTSWNPLAVLDRTFRSKEERMLSYLDGTDLAIPILQFTHPVPPTSLIPQEIHESESIMRQAQKNNQHQLIADTTKLPTSTKLFIYNLGTSLELIQGTFTPLGLKPKIFHVPHLAHEYLMQIFNFNMIAIEQLFLLWDIGYFSSRLKGGWVDPVDGSVNFHIVDDQYPDPFLWMSAGLPSGSIEQLSRPAIHAPLSIKALNESKPVYNKRKRDEEEEKQKIKVEQEEKERKVRVQAHQKILQSKYKGLQPRPTIPIPPASDPPPPSPLQPLPPVHAQAVSISSSISSTTFHVSPDPDPFLQTDEQPRLPPHKKARMVDPPLASAHIPIPIPLPSIPVSMSDTDIRENQQGFQALPFSQEPMVKEEEGKRTETDPLEEETFSRHQDRPQEEEELYDVEEEQEEQVGEHQEEDVEQDPSDHPRSSHTENPPSLVSHIYENEIEETNYEDAGNYDRQHQQYE